MSWKFRSGWRLWAGVAFALVPSLALGLVVGSPMGFWGVVFFVLAGVVALALGLCRMRRDRVRANRNKDAFLAALRAGAQMHIVGSVLIIVYLAKQLSAYEEAGVRHYDFSETLFAGLLLGSFASMMLFPMLTLPVCLVSARLVSRFVLRDA